MLYLCATPIGNLQDVTLRLLEVLRGVEFVACEDTRRTRILLERHDISARLVSFHDHNERGRVNELLPALREGKDVAVVSDAGMPGISDPGFVLVRACVAEGLPVTVLPGPSSVSTALVLSGLPADKFAFLGYLARAKRKLVEQIATMDGTGAAVVAFESPRRLRASLSAIGERWPERQIAVCRELTKLHEEVMRGTADEIMEQLPETVRGEIVLVLEADALDGVVTEDAERAAQKAMAELLDAGVGAKRAASVVSELTGTPKRALYEWGVRLKR